MTVVMAESSSNYTGVAVMFSASGTKIGAHVVAHVVFPTDLTYFSCLLMFGGGRTEFGESIYAGCAVLRCLVESLC